MTDSIAVLVAALRAYEKADDSGVMVLISRQACDEAADLIEKLHDGRMAVLPKTREHALALLTIAEACVYGNETFKPPVDPPASGDAL